MTRDQAIAVATAAGQPHELVDQLIDGRALRVFKQAPASLRALFEATASDLPFLGYEDERYSFAQAWQQASRIGRVLVRSLRRAQGRPRGACPCATTRNGCSPSTRSPHRRGGGGDERALGRPTRWPMRLADSGAKVLLADSERLQRWAQGPAAPGLQVLAVRAGDRRPAPCSLAALTERAARSAVADAAGRHRARRPGDHALHLGLDRPPQGRAVQPPQHPLGAAVLGAGRAVGELAAGHRARAAARCSPARCWRCRCSMSPGCMRRTWPATGRSGRVVCMYRWDAEAAAALIDRDKLSSVVAPAAMTGDLVRVAQAGGHDLSSLLTVGGGGAPRAPEQVRQIARQLRPTRMPNTGWGMTETNAIGTGIGGEDYLARPASSGRCSLVLQLKVVDETGQPLPAGQRGELLVRGTSVFQRLLEAARGQRAGLRRRRLVPHRRRGHHRRRGLPVHRRPHQGPDHPRRREHRLRPGRGRAADAPRRAGGGGLRRARRAPGRGGGRHRLRQPGARPGGAARLPGPAPGALRAAALYRAWPTQPLPRTPSGKILKRQIRGAALAQLLPTEQPPGTAS